MRDAKDTSWEEKLVQLAIFSPVLGSMPQKSATMPLQSSSSDTGSALQTTGALRPTTGVGRTEAELTRAPERTAIR